MGAKALVAKGIQEKLDIGGNFSFATSFFFAPKIGAKHARYHFGFSSGKMFSGYFKSKLEKMRGWNRVVILGALVIGAALQ